MSDMTDEFGGYMGDGSEIEAAMTPIDTDTSFDWLWETVLTLTDAIATIERKYHHKEITYDEYEEHSKRYETQAVAAIESKCKEREAAARDDELDRLVKSIATKKPNETWEAWCWRVTHYLQNRIAALHKRIEAQK